MRAAVVASRRWFIRPVVCVVIGPRPLTGMGPPPTAAVKSRIWTFQPVTCARNWHRADLRPVLPDRSWRRDLCRALDAPDHPQPLAGMRRLQRDPGGRPGTVPDAPVTTAQAARTAGNRPLDSQA